MKILFASSFDPAGVMTGYRNALRAAGHEAFVTVNYRYNTAPQVAMDQGEVVSPDVLVVCPGIGSGEDDWPTETAPPPEPDLPQWIEVFVTKAERLRIPRVALFHGSKNTAANVELYRDRYRNRGFKLATTTLDYAGWLDAVYLPPLVDVGERRAALRELRLGSPFFIAHAPTNPELCHTKDFLYAAAFAGARSVIINGVPLELCLKEKAKCHAGFDHLRGSFSVNTLENAALGLVPLFGLSETCEARMHAEGIDKPPLTLRDLDDLEVILRTLTESPELTRTLQEEARPWFERNFGAAALTERLVEFFGDIL